MVLNVDVLFAGNMHVLVCAFSAVTELTRTTNLKFKCLVLVSSITVFIFAHSIFYVYLFCRLFYLYFVLVLSYMLYVFRLPCICKILVLGSHFRFRKKVTCQCN